MEMLELQNLHKTFNPGTVNEKVALNGVSLKMEAGDFATIVGSNGAGKSTLFNAITGGFIADEGSILLGGQDITFAPEHQRSKVIGHLFQDPLKGTAPNMTIEENLALAYLRAAHGNPFSRISKKDKAFFADQLRQLAANLIGEGQLAVRERARAGETGRDMAIRLAVHAPASLGLRAAAVFNGLPLLNHDDLFRGAAAQQLQRREDSGRARTDNDNICVHEGSSLDCVFFLWV